MQGVVSLQPVVKGEVLKDGMESVIELLYYTDPSGSSHHAMPCPPGTKMSISEKYLGRTLLTM